MNSLRCDLLSRVRQLNARCFHTTPSNLKKSINFYKFHQWWIGRWKRERADKNFPMDYTAPEGRPKLRTSFKQSLLAGDLENLRYKYPEFLPDKNPHRRNKTRDMLVREDMLKRREVIDLPEFYVGSILAVTASDMYAPGKVSRFLGICIAREGQGMQANFTLRNVIDHEGIEIRYELYNPTIREIEVIKLEKRLDDQLYYLRDADLEYSTFPLDMEPVAHLEGEPVPINPIQVKMKPYPWTKRWEVVYPDIKGIDKLADVPDYYYYKGQALRNPYEKFDLMKDYRSHINEEDQFEIWTSIKDRLAKVSEMGKAERRRRTLQKT